MLLSPARYTGENKAAKKGWMEAERQEQVERQRKFEHQIFASQIRVSETADIAQLDDYIESLYEEDHVCCLQDPVCTNSMILGLHGFHTCSPGTAPCCTELNIHTVCSTFFYTVVQVPC